jgi:hypothetical protein
MALSADTLEKALRDRLLGESEDDTHHFGWLQSFVEKKLRELPEVPEGATNEERLAAQELQRAAVFEAISSAIAHSVAHAVVAHLEGASVKIPPIEVKTSLEGSSIGTTIAATGALE